MIGKAFLSVDCYIKVITTVPMHRLNVRAGNFVSLGDIGGEDYGGSPLSRKRNNAAFITDNNIIQN